MASGDGEACCSTSGCVSYVYEATASRWADPSSSYRTVCWFLEPNRTSAFAGGALSQECPEFFGQFGAIALSRMT
jgi:hypothetical protein